MNFCEILLKTAFLAYIALATPRGESMQQKPEPNGGSALAAIGGCETVTLNEVYRCPCEELPVDSEFLYAKVDGTKTSLYSGKLRGGVLTDSYMFTPPDGWKMYQFSISPDRKIVLVTMKRTDCPNDWPNTSGESCSWGRGVLWAGLLKSDSSLGKHYELVNLSTYYGKNSNVLGWHTWLTTKKVLFNANIKPDGVALVPDPARSPGFAYTMDFEHDDTQIIPVSSSVWGSTLINSEECLVGRMHASTPTTGYGDKCSAGQYVVIARRCYDDPMGTKNFSWYNTVNGDGSGGLCSSVGGSVQSSLLVPAFKNYVVEVDSECNPVSFDRKKPIRMPDYTGRYRHMGRDAEWGDGQPTIDPTGTIVAFWNKRSSTLARNNNCAGFESEDGISIGNAVDRIRICVLNGDQKCSFVVDLPEPANAWHSQGNAYFYLRDNGNPALFTCEDDGGYLTDLFTRERLRVFQGGGGYPLSSVGSSYRR